MWICDALQSGPRASTKPSVVPLPATEQFQRRGSTRIWNLWFAMGSIACHLEHFTTGSLPDGTTGAVFGGELEKSLSQSGSRVRSLIEVFYQQVVENFSPSPAPFPKYGEGEAWILQSPLSMLGEGVGGEEKRGIVQNQRASFPEGSFSSKSWKI